jgi:hypothetical protein
MERKRRTSKMKLFVFASFFSLALFFSAASALSYDEDYPVSQEPTAADVVKISIFQPVGMVANTYSSLLGHTADIYKDGVASIFGGIGNFFKSLFVGEEEKTSGPTTYSQTNNLPTNNTFYNQPTQSSSAPLVQLNQTQQQTVIVRQPVPATRIASITEADIRRMIEESRIVTTQLVPLTTIINEGNNYETIVQEIRSGSTEGLSDSVRRSLKEIKSDIEALEENPVLSGVFTNLNADEGTLYVDTTNNRVGIGTTTPQYTLDVDGTARFASIITGGQTVGGNFNVTGNIDIDGTAIIGTLDGLLYGSNGSIGTIATSSLGFRESQWTTNGSNIFYNTGNVGIGTSSPEASLDLVGNLRISQNNSVTSSIIINNKNFGQSSFRQDSVVSIGGRVLNPDYSSDGSGGYNVLIGRNATSHGGGNDYFNIVIGSNAQSTAYEPKNVVIGASALSNTFDSVAIGYQASALANSGIAIGSAAKASSSRAISIGRGVLVTGSQSAAIGGDMTISGTSTYAYGYDADASGGGLTKHGFGTVNPQNRVDIFGAAAVGAYAGVNVAPSNGLIVSGNVGIGTSTPGAKLNIYSASPLSSLLTLDIGSRQMIFTPQDTTTGGGVFGMSSGHRLDFVTNNIGRMTISSGGYVGIGETSPTRALDIVAPNNQQFRIRSTTTDSTQKNAYFQVGHYSNATQDFLMMLGASGSSANTLHVGGGSTGATAATDILFYTAGNSTTTTGTKRMQITSSGNVGIGTLTAGPSRPLEIYGASSGSVFSGLKIKNEGSAVDTIAAMDFDFFGSDAVGARIAGVRESAANFRSGLAFYTNSGSSGSAFSERMRIDYQGNIGVGTTTPLAKLDIVGSFNSHLNIGTINQAGNLIFRRGTDGSTTGKLGWLSATDGTVLQLENGSNLGEIRINPNHSNNNGFTTIYSGGTETLRATGGNVGIGTTTPGAKLHVLATTEQLRLGYDTSNYSSFTTSSTGGLTIASTGTNGNITLTPSGTGQILISDGTAALPGLSFTSDPDTGLRRLGSNTLSLVTGTADRVQIDSVGMTLRNDGALKWSASTNVGAGVDLALRRASAGVLEITESGAGTYRDLNLRTLTGSGTSTFAGNVGIGTTTPTAAKLVVQGSASGHALIGEWAGDSAYGAISLNGSLATGNYNFMSSLTDKSLYINRPTGTNILFRHNNSTQMTLDNSGNLGVGVSPSARLHSLSTTEQLRLGYDASNYMAVTVQNNGTTQFAPTGTNAGISLTAQTGGGITLQALQLTFRTNGANTRWVMSSAGHFNPNTTNAFDIGSASALVRKLFAMDGYFEGNVGIGTTSPAAKLSIQGSSDQVQLMVVGHTTQTNNLQEWRSGTGVLLSYIDNAGAFSNPSDRNLKENFTDLDKKEILMKINGLPIQQWNYKSQGDSVTHIGPMAQDFYEAFKVGGSSKAISTIDPSGVALLGIQALAEQFNDNASSTKKAFDTMDLRISKLESGSSSTTGTSGTLLDSVFTTLQSFGSSMVDGVAYLKNVFVQRFTTNNLTIKGEDPEKTGFTIYDRKTKEPLCVYFEDGEMKTEKGECPDNNEEKKTPLPVEPIDPVYPMDSIDPKEKPSSKDQTDTPPDEEPKDVPKEVSEDVEELVKEDPKPAPALEPKEEPKEELAI